MDDLTGRLRALALNGVSLGGGRVVLLTETVLSLCDEIERLRARRPVVCGSCKGDGVAHWKDCPDCGKGGCGPGVRYE